MINLDTIIQGDSLSALEMLADECVNCVITSPPYFGLRDYGVDGQIGLEESPELYVQKLVDVFRAVRRVMRADGTLWLNLGDSYAGSGMGGANYPESAGAKQSSNMGSTTVRGRGGARYGLKTKDLIGIPWMVAFALRADGWYLRQDIIWAKPNPMPESVTDRCTKSHEYIFLLSKSAKYYFDADSIKEPISSATVARLSQPNLENQRGSDRAHGGVKTNGPMRASIPQNRKQFDPRQAAGGSNIVGHNGNYDVNGKPFNYLLSGKRNKRSVWSVTTKPFKEAHFATFPPDLIEPMVLAGCPAGGVVLDPFMGAGTTGVVAKKLNRHFIGFELNNSYIEIANRRVGAVMPVLI